MAEVEDPMYEDGDEVPVVSLIDDLEEFDNLEDLDEVKDFLYLDDINIDLKEDEPTELNDLQAYNVQSNPENPVSSQLVVHKPVNLDPASLRGRLVLGPGFRNEPDPELFAASLGEDKPRLQVNDRWAFRQADQLRQKLNWDMSIPLGDLTFKQLDLLFSKLLATSVKKDGWSYPSETLMNMLNCLSRILKRASTLRAIEGRGQALESGFNIKKSYEFLKTQSTVRAAVKKSAREGLNKKRLKVYTLTIAMETAILADMDHQMANSVGCQKCLTFYIMCRLGIRGGVELYKMGRTDLKLIKSSTGKEYIV
jgi:hypothetical protein